MKKIVFILCCVLVGFPVAKADAGENDPGQQIQDRLDRRGDRIEERQDRKGDGIERRFDRKGDRIDAKPSAGAGSGPYP